MALITKIRKNFWFVLILLGLALAAFILMDVQGSQNLGGVGDTTMGMVNGKKIDYREYQITEGSYYRGSSSDVFTKRKTIWNYFVERSIIQDESSKMGLSVSVDELKDLQFGANVSPIIQQNWMNPQTRQLDVNQLQQIKTTIENGDEMNPDLRSYWAEQEKQIEKDALQKKLSNIVSKGIYTPKWMAEATFKDDNTKVDFDYVKIPFASLNETVNVTDKDYENYIANNQASFTTDEETRIVELASFTVIPTAQDSAGMMTSIQDLKSKFATAENDSLFVLANGGAYAPIYFKKEQLPKSYTDNLSSITKGSIYGPYQDNGNYAIIKTLDIQNIPDSVSARHILRNADPTNTFAVAEAEKYVDSLMIRLNTGRESWDSLAIKNSQDPSNAFKGGDLGTFTQGRMVGPFNDVCFITGKEGGVYKVKTQFGIHIIKIDDQIFTDSEPEYKVALLQKPIIPSEATQNAIYDMVADMVAENRSMESMQAALKGSGAKITNSNGLKMNDSTVGTLGSNQTSRDIIKWAFDPSTELQDVSPEVYSKSDPVNYFDSEYVIATLSSAIPAGIQPVGSVKNQITQVVTNQKKGRKAMKNMNFSDLEDLASQYGVTVQSSNGTTIANPFIAGSGSERDVVSKAFNTGVNQTSKPILGASGVYVIKTKALNEAGQFTNIPALRQTMNMGLKSATSSGLMEALKKSADIEDNRFTFF